MVNNAYRAANDGRGRPPGSRKGRWHRRAARTHDTTALRCRQASGGHREGDRLSMSLPPRKSGITRYDVVERASGYGRQYHFTVRANDRDTGHIYVGEIKGADSETRTAHATEQHSGDPGGEGRSCGGGGGEGLRWRIRISRKPTSTTWFIPSSLLQFGNSGVGRDTTYDLLGRKRLHQ